MRLSLDLGLGSRWSYDNTALGNGILAWMSRTGVWQDEANGQPTLWNDGEVWDDGVSRNFTAAAIDTNGQPGDICGTIAPLPDGGAVTYTLADTMGGRFAIDGANVVVGSTALLATTYNLVANAVNVSGWTWSVPCTVTVALGEIIAPVIAYQGLASSVGRNEIITAADLGHPDWLFDKNVLRHAPELLEGGIRPGVDLDWQGNLILQKITNGSSTRLLTLDPDLDYDFTASSWNSTTPLTTSVQLTTGRNVRVIGDDTGGRRFSLSRMKRFYGEGIRGDYTSTPEDDMFFVQGNDSVLPVYPDGSRFTVQNAIGDGLHGTYSGHGIPSALAFTITSDASKKIRIRLTDAATNPVVVGADVIVSGTVYNGVSRNLNDFNGTWTITDVVNDAVFFAVQNAGTTTKYSPLRPASAATDNTTGAIWVMTVGGAEGTNASHSDFFQHGNLADKKSAMVRLHNVLAMGNYVGTITQGVDQVQLSNWQYIFTHAADPLLNPTDDGTEAMRTGNDAIGSATGLKEFIQCAAVVRPYFDVWEQIAPNLSFGAKDNTAGADKWVSWDRDEFRGAVMQGMLPSELQQVWADLGFGYVANKTYWNEVTANSSSIEQVLLDGSTAISSSAPGGTRVGLLYTQNTLGDHSGRIDFSIDPETSEGYVFIQGRELVTTAIARPSSFTVKINAVLRGTAYGRQTTLAFTSV